MLNMCMKKLFLASSFAQVSNHFADFVQSDTYGKKITFIPTASIPETVNFYVIAAKKAFEDLGLHVDVLEITQATTQEIADTLHNNDYIYVSGGNTFFLLQELRKKRADILIADEIASGKIYIGESAGSVILAPSIKYIEAMDDVIKAPELRDTSGLSVIDFYPVPHYTNTPFKESAQNIMDVYGTLLPLIPISNTQVITVEGDNLTVVGL